METQAYTIIFYAQNSLCIDRLNFYNAQNWINMHLYWLHSQLMQKIRGKKQEKEKKNVLI